MTQQPIEQPAISPEQLVDPAQAQVILLKQIFEQQKLLLEEQKRTAGRLGWLVFFATLSFLSGVLAFFNAL
jgi:hypothetical protein